MCWSCVEEEDGHLVILDDDMKRVCNLIWDWYAAPDQREGEDYPINGCGGSLHVQLDDHNLDDCFLSG